MIKLFTPPLIKDTENSLRAYYFFVIQWSVIIIVRIFYVGVVFIAGLLQ